MFPKVKILMSTYNGEKYLKDQLESLVKQDGIDIDINVRDDGSSDKTIKILREFSQRYDSIHIQLGTNVGPSESFMNLLYDAEEGFDYYAFSDQDDIWETDKLLCAVEALRKFENEEALYYSALNTFNLREGERKLLKNDREYTFTESLMNSHFPGCTMVFNKKTYETIRKIERPTVTVMHDLYVAQIIIGLNKKIIYDTNSHINYRIHGNNVSVKSKGVLANAYRIYTLASKQKGLRLKASQELFRVLHDYVNKENLLALACISNYNVSISNKMNFIKMVLGTRFKTNLKLMLICSITFNFF